MENNDMKAASCCISINETSKRTRGVLDDAFKVKEAFVAIREYRTLNELSAEFGVHTNMVNQWMLELFNNVSVVFSGPKKEKK